MIYATSDTHCFHDRIIELMGRPFTSMEQMNNTIVANWNAVVTPQDEVWHLGDVAYNSERLWSLFDRLNGKKHLVIGNHDEANKQITRLPWQSIQHYAVVGYRGLRFVLSHFPMETWWRAERGYIHLHGHCHGSRGLSVVPHRFDMGSDCWGYAPVSFDTLAKLAIMQPFDPSKFLHTGTRSYV